MNLAPYSWRPAAAGAREKLRRSRSPRQYPGSPLNSVEQLGQEDRAVPGPQNIAGSKKRPMSSIRPDHPLSILDHPRRRWDPIYRLTCKIMTIARECRGALAGRSRLHGAMGVSWQALYAGMEPEPGAPPPFARIP